MTSDPRVNTACGLGGGGGGGRAKGKNQEQLQKYFSSIPL